MWSSEAQQIVSAPGTAHTPSAKHCDIRHCGAFHASMCQSCSQCESQCQRNSKPPLWFAAFLKSAVARPLCDRMFGQFQSASATFGIRVLEFEGNRSTSGKPTCSSHTDTKKGSPSQDLFTDLLLKSVLSSRTRDAMNQRKLNR